MISWLTQATGPPHLIPVAVRAYILEEHPVGLQNFPGNEESTAALGKLF